MIGFIFYDSDINNLIIHTNKILMYPGPAFVRLLQTVLCVNPSPSLVYDLLLSPPMNALLTIT